MSRGDPVDVATGRTFTLPVADLSLAGPLPLVVMRAYSSGARRRDIGLGFGWSHSLAWSIETTRSVFRVFKWDGTAVDFDAFEDGLCAYGPEGWVLSKHGARFVLLLENRTQLVFEAPADVDDEAGYQLKTVSDRFGNTIRLSYESTLLASVEDCVGRVIRVARHPNRKIAAFEVKNAWEQGRWVRFADYAYDSEGDLTLVTDAAGCTNSFEYVDHLLMSQRDPTGLTYHYRYDDAGRCIETWGDYPGRVDESLARELPNVLSDGVTPAKGIYHCLLTFSSDGFREIVDSVTHDRVFANQHGKVDKAVRAGAVYSRTYDENGHMASFTDPTGGRTEFRRDEFGRLLEVVDALGGSTKYERDARGNIERVVDPLGGLTEIRSLPDGLSWTDPLGAVFFVRHDARGLIIETHAPNGGVSRSHYDAHGNLVREQDRSGTVTERAYDYFGRCVAVRRGLAQVRYAFDERGDVVQVFTATGGVVRYRYDGSRHLVAVTGADNRTTEFLRAGDHRVYEVRHPGGTVTRFYWDREQRLREVVNASNERHRFELDLAGRVSTERTFDGRTINYRYDGAGRLKTVRCDTRSVSYDYDELGQLLRRQGPDFDETFRYDRAGRLCSAKRNGVSVDLDYNAVGWPTRQVTRVGEDVCEVSLTWDQMGDVVQRKTSLGHELAVERDAIGRPVRLELDGLEVVRGFDSNHQEVLRLLGAGGSVTSVRDAIGRLVERRADISEPSGPTVSQSWSYGARGEVSSTRDARTGQNSIECDAEGRLAAAIGADLARFFTYDERGNVFENAAGKRQYGPGNRLLQNGDRTYQWDAHGRLTRSFVDRDNVREATHYEWTADDMLARVRRPDGAVVEFQYDAFGRRVSKRVVRRNRTVATTRFFWDRTRLVHQIRSIAEKSGDPVVEETTFAFDDDGSPLAERRRVRDHDSGWLHYLNDPLGTPQWVVAPSGISEAAVRIDAWGRADEACPTPLRLAGQHYDDETGLSYNRFRYYDPALGRYISPDPVGVFGGTNLYAYAANEPTRLVDPTGLMPRTTITRPDGTTVSGRSAGTDRTGRPRTNDPAIASAVENARTSGAGQVPTNSHGNCAEVDALHNLADQIRRERQAAGETLRDPEQENQAIRRQLRNEVNSGRMETFDDDDERMNPCTSCGQILRELGLHPKSSHHERPGRKHGVSGSDGRPWNGQDCQQGTNARARDRSVRGRTPPFVE